jgi:sugar phosphate isomerase/epimerase
MKRRDFLKDLGAILPLSCAWRFDFAHGSTLPLDKLTALSNVEGLTGPEPKSRGAVAEGFADVAGPTQSVLTRFKLGAISDGFSQDFEEALKIMQSYGLSWVEVRGVWGKYNTEATPAEIRRLRELLEKYQFKCSVVDTALYKCTLPGTEPVEGEKDVYPYAGQMELLKRAMERAHAWGTDKIRGFTFWRLKEPQKHFARIAEELDKAGQVARSGGTRLVIENESICNAATGQELAGVLKLVREASVGANWDVGNGYWHGEVAFPNGYRALDKKRIWHMHVKGVACGGGFKDCHETLAGQGQNDLAGQFRALLRDKYQETMSLECEFEAPGLSHLETTRRSLEGLLKAMSKL